MNRTINTKLKIDIRTGEIYQPISQNKQCKQSHLCAKTSTSHFALVMHQRLFPLYCVFYWFLWITLLIQLVTNFFIFPIQIEHILHFFLFFLIISKLKAGHIHNPAQFEGTSIYTLCTHELTPRENPNHRLHHETCFSHPLTPSTLRSAHSPYSSYRR